MSEPTGNNEQQCAIHNVSNCPDLTEQWHIIRQKFDNREISDFEHKVLLDCLDLLDRKGIIALKLGI